MNLADDADMMEGARLTEGRNGADLNAICMEAGMFAIRQEHPKISHADFMMALDKFRLDFERDHRLTTASEMFA
jgi:proteasome regulatory subunit